jgi:hypothetical protein
VGRGAEGHRLAEKLGAVRDGYGTGLIHYAALGGRLPVCRYLLEDLRLDVDDDGPLGALPSIPLPSLFKSSMKLLALSLSKKKAAFIPILPRDYSGRFLIDVFFFPSVG